MNRKPRIVVVGGGITGIATAFFLSTQLPFPSEITLLEKEKKLGGQIHTEKIGEFLVETGPESFVRYKEAGMKFCQLLGLQTNLLSPKPDYQGALVYYKKKLHQLPDGIFSPFSIPPARWFKNLLFTKLLSWKGKLRLCLEPLISKQSTSADEPVGDFFIRRFGNEFFEVLVEPLLSGVYGGNIKALSTKTVLKEYVEAEQKHGSLLASLIQNQKMSIAISLKSLTNRSLADSQASFQSDSLTHSKAIPPESQANRSLADSQASFQSDSLTHSKPKNSSSVFATLRGGLQQLIDQAVSHLKKVKINLESTVEEINKKGLDYEIRTSSGKTIHTDALVLTCPASPSSALLEKIDLKLSQLLAQIPYASSTVVTLAFHSSDVNADIKSYGFLVPEKEGLLIRACTWTSHKWDYRAPSGTVLLRLYLPRIAADHEVLTLRILSELKKILNISATPIFMRIHEHPKAMPQYQVGHQDLVSQIQKNLLNHPGLFLAGAAFHGVGIADCIQSGENVSNEILKFLQTGIATPS